MNEEQKKLLGLERIILMQAFAEAYLYRQTDKDFSDVYPDVKHEYGLLTVEHVKLLKAYLKENFNIRKLDLNECIEKAGEKAMDEKLTEYEASILINMADDVIFVHDMIDRLKSKFLNK